METFVGSICIFGFNFAPRDWALCNGSLIPISQNTALFSLLGTYYGGNGTTNFALPNLQGRGANGQGQLMGSGSVYTMGETAGTDTATLTTSNMPVHNHTLSLSLNADNTGVNSGTPENTYLGKLGANLFAYAASATSGSNMADPTVTLGVTGSGAAFSIANPMLVLNYSIALRGIFPSRN